MFDSDAARIRRFVNLYLTRGIVMGHILALVVSVHGLDRLSPAARRQQLRLDVHTMQQAGVAGGFLDLLSDQLWVAYESGAQLPGSGIVIFPSMHIATATIVARYLYERHRVLLPLYVLIVATYQLLPVYQGWHYAIDGYFSILAMGACWVWLRRRDRQSGTSTAATLYPSKTLVDWQRKQCAKIRQISRNLEF